MKPPMHDSIIYMQPVLVDGKPIKDDHGFPEVNPVNLMARVIEESKLVVNDQGQEKQATHTVILPPSIHPNLGDQIDISGQVVVILQRKPRKSYSGKKTYYWVTNCGSR